MRESIDVPAGDRTPEQLALLKKHTELLSVQTKYLEKRFEDFKKEAAALQTQIEEAQAKLLKVPKIHALVDMGGEPLPVHIFRRGEPRRPGARVFPGVPAVLQRGIKPYEIIKPSGSSDTSGQRLALARWVVQQDHPLTARVMVNRIWQHHFDRGLVSTPGNLGSTGEPPSHPQLLDWLATELVRQQWSLKAMHRVIMTSAVYRQRSSVPQSKDPDNVLLSRFPLRRLDAEALRDAILHVSCRLDTTPFGPADDVNVAPDGEVTSQSTPAGFRRSIYVAKRHDHPVSMLKLFDAPRRIPNCLRRTQTTVPTQELFYGTVRWFAVAAPGSLSA